MPAEFTIDEDDTTHDLTGRSGPLMEILQVLHANGIPLGATLGIRSNPVACQQVMEIVRAAGAEPPAGAASAVSQCLQQLEALRARGTITDAEYAAKRREILADL